jgi:hypothetical protein
VQAGRSDYAITAGPLATSNTTVGFHAKEPSQYRSHRTSLLRKSIHKPLNVISYVSREPHHHTARWRPATMSSTDWDHVFFV